MDLEEKISAVWTNFEKYRLKNVYIPKGSCLIHSGSFKPEGDYFKDNDIWVAEKGNKTVDDYFLSAPFRVKSVGSKVAFQTHFEVKRDLYLLNVSKELSFSGLLQNLNGIYGCIDGEYVFGNPDDWHRKILPAVVRGQGVDGVYQEFSDLAHEIMIVDFSEKLAVKSCQMIM
jgi:hypothetical protein